MGMLLCLTHLKDNNLIDKIMQCTIKLRLHTEDCSLGTMGTKSSSSTPPSSRDCQETNENIWSDVVNRSASWGRPLPQLNDWNVWLKQFGIGLRYGTNREIYQLRIWRKRKKDWYFHGEYTHGRSDNQFQCLQ